MPVPNKLYKQGLIVVPRYYQDAEYCSEFHLVDLRVLDNWKKVTKGQLAALVPKKSFVLGCDWVFNLAADMGGMGFIQSNNSVVFPNSLIQMSFR